MPQYASYSGYIGGGSGGGGSITSINGQSGPAISIDAGPGINVTTVSNTITISTIGTMLGAAQTIYVDTYNGSDSLGNGNIEAPFKTIKAAQSSLVSPSATKIYTIQMAAGTYQEDPTWQPAQYVNYVGAGQDLTFIQHSDDSPIVLSYGGTDSFEQVFQDFSVFDEFDISRQAAQTCPAAQFLINQVTFYNDINLTGAGDNTSSIFDIFTFLSCTAGGQTTTANAVNFSFSSCNMAFLTVTPNGVDSVSTEGIVEGLNNSSFAFVTIAGVIEVDARNTKVNRWTLQDTNATITADVASWPAGQAANTVTLTGGATMAQITPSTIEKRLRTSTKQVTTGANTPNAFVDQFVRINKTVAGPTTITMPTMSPGNFAEGNKFSFLDYKGDAATNNTTVNLVDGSTFSNGLTSDLLMFNNARHDYQFSNNRWDLGPVSRMGDKMFGDLFINSLQLMTDFNSAFWGPGMLGVVSNSLTFNQPDATNKTIIFGSGDIPDGVAGQTIVSADVTIQSGTNLNGSLSLSGTHATGDIWIHTGDIPNDLSGYKPGDIRIYTGFNSNSGASGGLELNASGISNTAPLSNQILMRATNISAVDTATGTIQTLNIDTNAQVLDMKSHKIVNVLNPTNPQDAATKSYVDSSISGSNVTLTAFGSTPNADAASLSGQALTLQPADGTHPGGVSTLTQTFAGNKTFSGSLTGQSLTVNGTAGSGFVTLNNQSSTPATPVSAITMFADSTSRWTTVNPSGFTATWDTSSITANRVYTTRDVSGKILLDSRMSLAGSTISSSPVTILSTDAFAIYFVDTTAARTINLPTSASVADRMYIFKDISGTAQTNNITLVPNGTDKIEGLNVNKLLTTNYGSWTIISDAAGNWWMI